MSEQSKDKKLRLPTRKEVISIGTAASMAMGILAPAAKAQLRQHAEKTASEPVPTHVDTSRQLTSAEQGPNAKEVHAWVTLMNKMKRGEIPDVVMTGILELPAGTLMAYGPNAGAHGTRIPEGHTGFAEFGQMFDIDGKVVVRAVVFPNAPSHSRFEDALDSRFISLDQPGLKVLYTEDMDPNKGYPRAVPAAMDDEHNLRFNAEYASEPPTGMVIGALFIQPNSTVGEFLGPTNLDLDHKPGRLPTLADIHK